MPKLATLSRFALALGLVAVLGCGESSAPPAPPPPTVTVATPVSRDVTRVYEFTGRTEAVASVEIRARVQGFLEQVEFEPSTFVKEGELLFVIEREPFIARRDRLSASLKSTEAGLRAAESDLERLELAIKTNAVSQQEVTRARAERDQAGAALLAARAELQNADIELAYTKIESPIDGMISRNLVDAGNLVGQSPTILATVRQIDPIYAYFEIDERRFAHILKARGGHNPDPEDDSNRAAATLILEETDHEVTGRVDSVDNTVDTSTGTIMLRAVFENPDALLFPGMYVQIQLDGEVIEGATLIDERAVGADLGGKYVYTLGEGNVVEQRYVEVGPRQDDGTVVILDGLEGDERYIVEGLLRARPGRPVTPEDAAGGA